ncbi:MAG: tetratricopeptide repeat protein [Gemmatimonadota bacterium]
MAVHSSRNMITALVALLMGLSGCASGGGGGSSGDSGLDVGALMAEARDVEEGVAPRETENTQAAEDHLDAADDADDPAQARQHYQLALQSAEAAIAEDAQNPLAYRLAALAHLGLDEYQEAGAAFDQAQELRPIYEFEDVGIRENAYIDQYQMASPLLGTGDYEQAAEYLENADAIYHGRPEAKITLAQIYASLREHDLALEKIDETLAFLDSDAVADMDEETVANWRQQAEGFPLLRAQVLADAGRFEEAAAAYRTLVAANPNDMELRQDLAAILTQMGENEEALQVYRELADQPGLDADGLSRIGLGLYQADQFAEAATILERAADASPMDRDAIEWWARSLLEDSAYAAIPPVAERWLELDPNSGQGHAILAQAANMAGDTQLAAQTIQSLEALEFAVDNLQMRRNPNGGADVSGSVTNRSMPEGSEVTLVFTFYDTNGTPVGEATQTVSLGAENMSNVFQFSFDSDQQVDGYGYTVG